VLERRARLLGDFADAINVIQRPGRQSSLEASLSLRSVGLEPAWHLVTRGRTRAEVSDDLLTAAAGGIDQVLCILGDHAAAPTDASLNIRDAIAMACDALPGALVGATLNQYGKDPEAVLRNLIPKLRAGATYVQTQPIFEPGSVERYAVAIDRERSGTRIIAMAMPLLSLDAGRRIEERLGIRLPDALREVLAAGDPELAWSAFTATLEALVAAPYIDGVAIMTFEGDAPAGTGEHIVAGLRAAGAIE
jgi:methylenetetrahydrofolate reductase (NADPH)